MDTEETSMKRHLGDVSVIGGYTRILKWNLKELGCEGVAQTIVHWRDFWDTVISPWFPIKMNFLTT
jgi:hypothetical protein